jgi:hypothetical protein
MVSFSVAEKTKLVTNEIYEELKRTFVRGMEDM